MLKCRFIYALAILPVQPGITSRWLSQNRRNRTDDDETLRDVVWTVEQKWTSAMNEFRENYIEKYNTSLATFYFEES